MPGKFPKYITQFPPAGEPDIKQTRESKETSEELYKKAQKEDFLRGIKFIEDHILTLKLETLSSQEIINLLKKLHGIVSATVMSHPCSRVSLQKLKAGEFRIHNAYTFKTPPYDPEIEYPDYNIEQPWDIFSILLAAFDEERATNFIKWYCKTGFHTTLKVDNVLKLLDSRMKQAIESQMPYKPGLSVLVWRQKQLNGMTLPNWLQKFFKENDKIFRLPKADVKRTLMPNFFTDGENNAKNIVLTFFPEHEKIPGMMQEFGDTLRKAFASKMDPIRIASLTHEFFTHHIHPFPDCNGRVARLLVNTILIYFGYPAIQMERTSPNSTEKRKYYRAIENCEINPGSIEQFIISKIEDQQIQSLCVAARDDKIERCRALLEMRANVNKPELSKAWTPLHYACAKKHIKTAQFLIAQGASLDTINDKQKTPLFYLDVEQAEGLKSLKALVDKDERLRKYLYNPKHFKGFPVLKQFTNEHQKHSNQKLIELVTDYAQECEILRAKP